MQNEQEEKTFKIDTLQYKIYKGMSGKLGALRCKLKKPDLSADFNKQEGCVFLEMAPAIGENQYDWKNGKIVMALSVVDLSKIILFLRSPGHPDFVQKDGTIKLNLFHDKNAGTASKGKDVKTLAISKSDKTSNFMFNLFHSENGNKKNASVTVSPDEAIVLVTLFTAAIPIILAWT